MCHLVDEYESAEHLVKMAVQYLTVLDPENELLRYSIFPEEKKERFWNKALGPWQEGVEFIVKTITDVNYYLAMKKEIEKISGRFWNPYERMILSGGCV